MQLVKNKFLFLLIVLFLFSCNNGSGRRNVREKNFSNNAGRVVKIVDGDTYDILIPGNSQIRIRMDGIDAPERGMPFYKAAKTYLSDLCFQRDIRLEIKSKDRYGRTIAKSFLNDGRELGEEMIKAGMAWHFKKYSSEQKLAEFEIEARNKKLGLWADESPTPPWVVRKSKQASRSQNSATNAAR